MSRFGIRNKIKSLIGGGARPQPAPLPRFKVTFDVPDGTHYEVEAKEGDSLVLASGRGPQPISTGCADSTCGTCQVEVLSGGDQLTPSDEQEQKTKADNAVDPTFRLGCQTGIIGEGVRVRVINVYGDEPE